MTYIHRAQRIKEHLLKLLSSNVKSFAEMCISFEEITFAVL